MKKKSAFLGYVRLCYVASVFEKRVNKAAAFFLQASKTILRHMRLLSRRSPTLYNSFYSVQLRAVEERKYGVQLRETW